MITNNLKRKKWVLMLSFLLMGRSGTTQNRNQIIKACASDCAAGDLHGYPVAVNGDYIMVEAIDNFVLLFIKNFKL